MEYKSARRMLRRLAPRAALAATIVVVVVALPRAPISRWADAIAGEEGETVNLRIRVTGEGEAVANAEVFVRSVEGEFQESATTNKKGEVSIAGVPAGEVLIQVVPPEHWDPFGRRYDLRRDELLRQGEPLSIGLTKKPSQKSGDQGRAEESGPVSIWKIFQ